MIFVGFVDGGGCSRSRPLLKTGREDKLWWRLDCSPDGGRFIVLGCVIYRAGVTLGYCKR